MNVFSLRLFICHSLFISTAAGVGTVTNLENLYQEMWVLDFGTSLWEESQGVYSCGLQSQTGLPAKFSGPFWWELGGQVWTMEA